MPDGRIARFEVPEGTTPEQAQAMIAAQLSGQQQDDPFARPQGDLTPPSEPRPDMARADAAFRQAESVIGELAAAMNRDVASTIDLLGPDAINAGLRMMGIDYQIPDAKTFHKALTYVATGTPEGAEGGFMDPGIARDAVRTAGRLGVAAGGMVPVARSAATAGGAVADLLGFGSSKAPMVAAGVDEAKMALLRGEPENITAGRRLDPEAPIDQPRVIPDPKGKAAISQGAPEGMVASIKAANPKTRANMKRSLDILEKGMKNDTFASMNRPADPVGDSLLNRIKFISQVNDKAAGEIDSVAKGLKGQSVDVQPAIARFMSQVQDMGVKLDPADNSMSLAHNSPLRGIPGAQSWLKRVVSYLRDDRPPPDAYDVHQAKRWIDNLVDYGKRKGGTLGNLERVAKTLRHDLDELLDTQFPTYNEVNTRYAETRNALDSIQDVVGRKVDLQGKFADKALGQELRKLLSNYRSRTPMLYAVEEVDEVATKYLQNYDGPPRIGEALSDELMPQVRLIASLEDMFGSFAPKAFMAEIASAAGQVARGDKVGAGQKVAESAYNFVTRKSPERALNALRALLEEN